MKELNAIVKLTESFKNFSSVGSKTAERMAFNVLSMDDNTVDELIKNIKEVKEKIHLYFEQQTASKDENFANGRLVRNLYDDLVMNHAKRVINITNPGIQELSTIKAEDFVVDEVEKG